MNDADTDRLAAGCLQAAQARLVQRYPFHARFVTQWRVQPSHAVATMAVTVRQAAIWLLYHPDFVTRCSLDELRGVLLHEVHHLLFGHLWADPGRYPDRSARVIAEEVTVNEWVREPLPGQPVTLTQFPELPPDEDTDTRYRRLAGNTISLVSVLKKSQAVQKMGPAVPKNAAGVPEISPSDSPANESADGAAIAVAAASPPTMLPPTLSPSVEPLDDHSLWGEARQAGAVGKLAVREAVRQAAAGLTPQQWERLPAALRRRVREAAEFVPGDQPGSFQEDLARSAAATVDWRGLLRRYVRQAVEAQPVFHRPPRRYPELAGIVPGYLSSPGRARVLAVIDTSGSMDTATLEAIAAELERMRSLHEVVVVECDAVVQAVYPLRRRLSVVHGRGGTDLRPPFATALLGQLEPNVMVYLTDGHGPAPERPPPLPVIWCLTAGSRRPTPWGSAVYLPKVPRPSSSGRVAP